MGNEFAFYLVIVNDYKKYSEVIVGGMNVIDHTYRRLYGELT